MIVYKRVTTTIAVLSVLTVGLVAGIAIPSAMAIGDILDETAAGRATLDERIAMVKYIRESSASRQDARERLRRLSRLAVHEGDELSFITSLENMAAKAGLEQTIVLETNNQKELSPWERIIPLRLALSGTYPQFRRYLYDLEHSPYSVMVQGVTLAGAGGSSAENPEGEVNAQINALVYWIGKNAPAFAVQEEAVN